VRSVEVDLSDDRFDVLYDPELADTGGLLEAVRALGYAPEVVTRRADGRAELERVDVALLPSDLQQLLARSRAARTPILLDFFAPG
jgi:hypothetical protein